jgi:hypothetical protein
LKVPPDLAAAASPAINPRKRITAINMNVLLIMPLLSLFRQIPTGGDNCKDYYYKVSFLSIAPRQVAEKASLFQEDRWNMKKVPFKGLMGLSYITNPGGETKRPGPSWQSFMVSGNTAGDTQMW